jgi:hypothetical protein
LGKYGLQGLPAEDRVYPVDGDLWTNVAWSEIELAVIPNLLPPVDELNHH